MADLKLAKLPDRKPVRITITLMPDLNVALQTYAAAYRQTYGEQESVAELIPYMLESFLESDRSFAKALKDGEVNSAAAENTPPHMRRGRRPSGSTHTAETTR